MIGEEGQCRVIADQGHMIVDPGHVTGNQGHMIFDPVIGDTTALELGRDLEENRNLLYEGHTVKNQTLLKKLRGEPVEVKMRKALQTRKMSWRF